MFKVLSWSMLGRREDGASWGCPDARQKPAERWRLSQSWRRAGALTVPGGAYFLKISIVSGCSMAAGRRFHPRIVHGKKENLYGSLVIGSKSSIFVFVGGFCCRVRLGYHREAIRWCTILFKNERRICLRQSLSCCRPRSLNIWVTLPQRL